MGDLLEALSLMRRVAAAESFRRDQNIVYQHVVSFLFPLATQVSLFFFEFF